MTVSLEGELAQITVEEMRDDIPHEPRSGERRPVPL
jgi:hypothetical protein